jgi:hypothetical protein
MTDDGSAPKSSSQRIYVCTPITTQYELAMKLAIDHTLQEIKKFYEAAKDVEVMTKPDGTKLLLSHVLKMDDTTLDGNHIEYKKFPNKKRGYTGPPTSPSLP